LITISTAYKSYSAGVAVNPVKVVLMKVKILKSNEPGIFGVVTFKIINI